MTTNQEFGQLGQQGMIYLSDHPVTSRCTAVRSGLGSRTIYADSAPVRCALRGRVLARALRFSVLLGGLEPWNFHISGIIIPIDSYVSKGLKPPTSVCRTDKTRDYWWLLRIFYKSMQYKCMWSYIYIYLIGLECGYPLSHWEAPTMGSGQWHHMISPTRWPKGF